MDEKKEHEIELCVNDKAKCVVCGRVFPYEKVYWYYGLRICGNCYPQATGKPVPEYWR